MRAVDDARNTLEVDVIARFGGGQQRLPDCPLSLEQRFVGVGPVAQRVGFGIGEQVTHRLWLIWGNHIERVIRHVAIDKGGGVNFRTLPGPFRRQRFGSGAGRHDLGAARHGFEPATVE